MLNILYIFALWIGWFGHQPTRGKSIAPSIVLMVDGFKRIDNMARKKTLEEVVEDFRRIRGDRFDYSLIRKENYVNEQSEVPIICPVHGVVYVTPHYHVFSKYGCHLCGKEHQGGGVHVNKRRLICGVGVNDSTTSTGSSKKREPSYALWKSILSRCYGKIRKKQKTYANCSICDEWIFYSNFKRWFDDPANGYKRGYHIYKDILVKGNKVYSPDACCFVPPEINTLIVKHDATRGDLPIGVTRSNYETLGFRAIVRLRGKYHTIGYFYTIEDAFQAYKMEKEAHIKNMATQYFKDGKITEKVYNALISYKVEITD